MYLVYFPLACGDVLESLGTKADRYGENPMHELFGWIKFHTFNTHLLMPRYVTGNWAGVCIGTAAAPGLSGRKALGTIFSVNWVNWKYRSATFLRASVFLTYCPPNKSNTSTFHPCNHSPMSCWRYGHRWSTAHLASWHQKSLKDHDISNALQGFCFEFAKPMKNYLNYIHLSGEYEGKNVSSNVFSKPELFIHRQKVNHLQTAQDLIHWWSFVPMLAVWLLDLNSQLTHIRGIPRWSPQSWH